MFSRRMYDTNKNYQLGFIEAVRILVRARHCPSLQLRCVSNSTTARMLAQEANAVDAAVEAKALGVILELIRKRDPVRSSIMHYLVNGILMK